MLNHLCCRRSLPSKSRIRQFYRPKTIHSYSTEPRQHVYVLTLETDRAHNTRMTALRDKYFPKHLNKLSAHLTLFHALPESRLETSIIPVIQDVANQTYCFNITAGTLFKLGKPARGIGIGIPQDQGGNSAKAVRDKLVLPWKKEGFLSRQDAVKREMKGNGTAIFPHYTIMNKVDNEGDVKRAWKELESEFVPDHGVVEGLGLYRYEKGWWRWFRGFDFVNPRKGVAGEKN